jgi:predicted TIM-barrel fold metal-dependent hydrolase
LLRAVIFENVLGLFKACVGRFQMNRSFSRRKFLTGAAAAAAISVSGNAIVSAAHAQGASSSTDPAERIIDMHVHFDETNPNFVRDLIKVIEPLNVTACVLTPYANRQVIADAARQYPSRIIPIGFLDLDAPDALKQAQDFHALGYRGLGELEFVRKPYTDPAYMPVYELANKYSWVVLFHTGIVVRQKFDQPEDVASYRMRAFHLEEIARRFPRITVLGAHCGNPEYEWAGEVARWNPNVFFDLSGSSLTKMQDRLADLRKVFWWTGTKWKTKTPDDDPNAFVKLVFGSDEGLDGIAPALAQYRAMFKACDVPPHTQKLILGGTLAKIFQLPE